MKKIMVTFYSSISFFVCSLFAVMVKYTTTRGGFIDFSELFVLTSFIFLGIIMFLANFLIATVLKRKQILNSILMYQVLYLAAYISICVISGMIIEPIYSYGFVFLMPFILLIIIAFINTIINIINKPIYQKIVFGKVSVIVFIMLLCFLSISITYFYVKWDSYKEWAQRNETFR